MFNNNYNPYYTQPQRFQPVEPITQPINTINTQPYIPSTTNTNHLGLLGKSVESIDVVKAMDIPLDGSTSYFPLTDGSAIVTKKIQNDGTSKTIVYKPVEEESKSQPVYVTMEDVEKKMKEFDSNGEIKSVKEELKNLKKQIKEIKLDMNDKED